MRNKQKGSEPCSQHEASVGDTLCIEPERMVLPKKALLFVVRASRGDGMGPIELLCEHGDRQLMGKGHGG